MCKMSSKFDIRLDFKSEDPAEKLNSFSFLLNRIIDYAYATSGGDEETDPRENFVFLILIISTMYRGAMGRHEIENKEIKCVTGFTDLVVKRALEGLKRQGVLSYLLPVPDKDKQIDWHFEFDFYKIVFGKTKEELDGERRKDKKRSDT